MAYICTQPIINVHITHRQQGRVRYLSLERTNHFMLCHYSTYAYAYYIIQMREQIFVNMCMFIDHSEIYIALMILIDQLHNIFFPYSNCQYKLLLLCLYIERAYFICIVLGARVLVYFPNSGHGARVFFYLIFLKAEISIARLQRDTLYTYIFESSILK